MSNNTIHIGTAGDDNVNRGPGKKDLIRIYPDRSGEIRWKRQRPNGRVISDSGEGYKAEADALDGMRMANSDWQDCRVVNHVRPTEGETR